MTGIFKHRIVGSIAAVSAGLLMLATPVAAGTGAGAVEGTVNFNAGAGVPVTGCGAVAGVFVSTVLAGTFTVSGVTVHGTAAANAAFNGPCDSLSAGAGTVTTVNVTPLSANVSCTLSGSYSRHGGAVTVNLSGSCTAPAAGNVTATVAANFTPTKVDTTTTPAQVSSASFAGAYVENG